MKDVELLKDDFKIVGTEFTRFKEETKKIAERTKDLIVYGRDITFISLCDIPQYQRDGKTTFYKLSDECVMNYLKNGESLKLGTISTDLFGEELINEMRKTTQLMAIINNEKYLISDIAIPTLSIRASVSGNLTVNRQNFIRNLHFADAIFSKNEKVHFVYRKVVLENGVTVKKIFSALGGAYAMIPQTILTTIANTICDDAVLGKTRVREWLIDQEFTNLYLEFPEASEEFKEMYKLKHALVPGVFLCTSDVGSSSIICRGVYRADTSYVITDEVMLKHTSSATAIDINKKIDDELFTNVRKLPEALGNLIGEEVINYSTIDITSKAGEAVNFDAVRDIMERTLKKALKPVLPVKRQKELLERLVEEINPTVRYTLYDIAINLMQSPDRIEGLDNTTLTEVRKALSKIPYYISRHEKKVIEEPKLVLLPA